MSSSSDQLEIERSIVAIIDMILYNRRTTKALTRLCGCTGWYVPLTGSLASPDPIKHYMVGNFAHLFPYKMDVSKLYFMNTSRVSNWNQIKLDFWMWDLGPID